MHMYHDGLSEFPIGAKSNVPSGKIRWGVGWQVQLLPHLEQSALYSETSQLFNSFQKAYGELYDGVVVPAYICPSSPFEALLDGGFSSGADTSQRAHYTGLAGAVDDTNDGGTFVETRQRPAPGGTESANGIISGGGLLLLNSSANIAGATDGTSNTAFIGEVSNYLLDAATPPPES